MADGKVYPIPQAVADDAYITENLYNTMYQQSIDDPDTFWGDMAEEFISFSKPWDKVSDWHYADDKGNPDVSIKWFSGAKLNVTYNCIDRHLAERADQTAIIWEGDNPDNDKKITYVFTVAYGSTQRNSTHTGECCQTLCGYVRPCS